jgi:hypothetical protein
MSKPRPSLEALAGTVSPPVVGYPVTRTAPAGSGRRDKPHVSVYLDKRVQRVIKEIALAYDRKPHDLYIEGINLMLRSYGKGTVDEIAPNVTTFPR